MLVIPVYNIILAPNALVYFSYEQLQRSADINAGTGIVTIGLACLIIGEGVIKGRKSLTRNILACLVGNIVYRFIYAIVLQTRIIPIEGLKLMTAIIVALAIAAPAIKDNMAISARARKEGRRSC